MVNDCYPSASASEEDAFDVVLSGADHTLLNGRQLAERLGV
jgi:hypothetical protein